MTIISNGKTLEIPPRGMTGPDGNPIGTVISFLGTSAPTDYLVCDGSTYSIADYYHLTTFFKDQFGSVNHFGGDGVTTFAVPDLRNLFLRGYRGESEDQLSGEIGEKQEGTVYPYISQDERSRLQIQETGRVDIENPDSISGSVDVYHIATISGSGSSLPIQYTSRPVNMAVLYCIKAMESIPFKDPYEYSTSEVVVGRWIDGKPLYRKVIHTFAPSTASPSNSVKIADISPEIEPVSVSAFLKTSTGQIYFPNFYQPTQTGAPYHGCSLLYNGPNYSSDPNCIRCAISGNTLLGQPITIILEYTKTTDQEVK